MGLAALGFEMDASVSAADFPPLKLVFGAAQLVGPNPSLTYRSGVFLEKAPVISVDCLFPLAQAARSNVASRQKRLSSIKDGSAQGRR